jgi:hypothetical protein
MTPKEKAKELVDKYYQLAENVEWTTDDETKEKSVQFNDELGVDVLTYWNQLAKESALIAVDEILDLNLGLSNCDENNWYIEKFYKEVKQEINKL